MKRFFLFSLTVAVANLLCVFVIAQTQTRPLSQSIATEYRVDKKETPRQDQLKLEIDDFVRRANETYDRSKRTLTVNLIRKNQKFLIEELNFKIRKGQRLTSTFSYSVKRKRN